MLTPMPLLHYRVRYSVSGLWIDPEILGWEHSYPIDEATVTIRLPEDHQSYTARDFESELVSIPSATVAPTFNEPGHDSRTAAVQLFMVRAAFEAPLEGDRPESMDEGTHPYWKQAQEACELAQPMCDIAATHFLRWVRARSKQPWLGLLAEQPRQYGRAGLLYADGRQVMGFGPAWKNTYYSSQLRLQRSDLDAIGGCVENQEPVPVTLELLNDARYLDEGSEVQDLKRAVITAATACEVRTNEVMTEHISPDRAKLLQMMLERTSGLPFILDEVLEASFGLSLKVADFDLWERVRKLMKQRNAVVHEGAEVDASAVAGRPAQVAVDLFSWLDSTLK